jgi:hypothetical protein
VQVSEQDVWKTYQNPVAEKLKLKQAMQALLSRMRELLPLVRPEPEPLVRKEAPKVYDRPQFRKLTSAQASLILLGHAGVGDSGAKGLIEIVFPEQRPPREWPH